MLILGSRLEYCLAYVIYYPPPNVPQVELLTRELYDHGNYELVSAKRASFAHPNGVCFNELPYTAFEPGDGISKTEHLHHLHTKSLYNYRYTRDDISHHWGKPTIFLVHSYTLWTRACRVAWKPPSLLLSIPLAEKLLVA